MTVVIVVAFMVGWLLGFRRGRLLGKAEGLLEEARRQRMRVEELLS